MLGGDHLNFSDDEDEWKAQKTDINNLPFTSPAKADQKPFNNNDLSYNQ